MLDNYDILRGKRERIKHEIIEYLQNTLTVNDASEEIVSQEGLHLVTISKLHSVPNGIWSLETDVLFGDGIATQLCRLVEEAIVKKKAALEKKEKRFNIIYTDKVLLLHNAYGFNSEGFNNPDVRQSCIIHLTPLLKDFHTLFWIHNPEEKKGGILYSVDSDWKA